jgi:hypothetical protein
MKHFEKCPAAFVLTVLLLAFPLGTAVAGTEASVADEVSFSVTDAAAYTYHTTDGSPHETATVDFRVAFDESQSGYLQGAIIKLEYDPDYVTLNAAHAANGWGTIDPGLTVIPGNPTRIVYILDPDPGTSTIGISTTPTLLAKFEFFVECHESWTDAPITIKYGPGETWVDDGTDIHHVTESSRINDGQISRWSPYWALWMIDDNSQADYPGALGTTLDIPLILGSIFRVASADVTLTYDIDELEFLGIDDWEDPFTSATVSYPSSGQVRFELETDESVYPRREFSGADPMLSMQFKVIGDWEGETSVIGYASTPIFEVAQDYGTCDLPFSQQYKVPGTLNIPNYAADLTTAWLDDGTISLVDDDVEMQVQMTNNFPAGKAQNAIVVNLDLGSDLVAEGSATGADMTFGLFTYNGPEGQEVSLRTMDGTGFAEVTENPADLVSFNITTSGSFEPPTDYDDRVYPISYQTPFNASVYDALVADTTGEVETTEAGGDLTWDSPEVEYLMGEYYCNYASGGQGHVNQSYYTRTAFDLHDFRVKIVVSGAHYMYDITPEPGVDVESFDNVGYKWAILATNASWIDQAATDTRTKFATITYAYTGGSILSKEADGFDDGEELIGPGGGYYITKLSTVTFEDADPGVYYMTDPSDNEHHQVSIGNTVKSRWWVDPVEPRDLIDLTGMGLPEEYTLVQNYPNPFNPDTDITFALPEAGRVELVVYNIGGQQVATLVDGWLDAGVYTRTWNGSDVASGVYFYRLHAGDYAQSRKMVLLK